MSVDDVAKRDGSNLENKSGMRRRHGAFGDLITTFPTETALF
jgi:hypothetical protein